MSWRNNIACVQMLSSQIRFIFIIQLMQISALCCILSFTTITPIIYVAPKTPVIRVRTRG